MKSMYSDATLFTIYVTIIYMSTTISYIDIMT